MLTAAWLDGAPFVASHPGDLEWWYASVAPDPLDVHLRLWFVDESVACLELDPGPSGPLGGPPR